ncbi:unnamed protein product, partial [marine sediment metagenome]
GIFGLIAKQVKNKPMISVIHGSDLNYLPEKSSMFHWLAKKIINNSDLVVVLSLEHQQKLIIEYHVEPKKIFLALPGPKISYEEIARYKKIIKQTSNFKDRYLILFIGRHFIKRGEDFIRSFKYLNDQKYQGIMIVDDAQERKRLRKIQHDSKINDIIILPGVKNNILLLIISIADVLVIPSLSEGISTTGLEALICGRPIIATPVGEIRKYLIPGQNGFFVEQKKPAQIAQAVEKLFSNYQQIQNNVFQQQEKIYDTYNFDQFLIRLNRRKKRLKLINN